jgi:imidazoleglycerol-phosphate dehydratase
VNGRNGRSATVERKTSETSIRVALDLDGSGRASIETGVPFLDHMLDALSRHSAIDLEVAAKGDIHIDDHHTVEDVGIAIGQALDSRARRQERNRAFGYAEVPLDEALVAVTVDLSGRPYFVYNVKIRAHRVGSFDVDLVNDFLQALMNAGQMNLHVNQRYGATRTTSSRRRSKAWRARSGRQWRATRACTACLRPKARCGSRPMIAVVDYGVGNLRSVAKALERVGASVEVTSDSAPDSRGRCRGVAGRRRVWPLHGEPRGRRARGRRARGGCFEAPVSRHLRRDADPVRRERGVRSGEGARNLAGTRPPLRERLARPESSAHGLEQARSEPACAAPRRNRRRRLRLLRALVLRGLRSVAGRDRHGLHRRLRLERLARQPVRRAVPPGEEPGRRAQAAREFRPPHRRDRYDGRTAARPARR